MIVNTILRAIFPSQCVGCGLVSGSGHSLCDECQQLLPQIRESYCRVCGVPILSEDKVCMRCRDASDTGIQNRSAFEYYHLVRDIVHQYKFSAEISMAGLLAPYLLECWEYHYNGLPLVPVPANPANIRTRGWDQVGILLKEMKRLKNIPCYSLLKRKKRESQKHLSRDDRFKNASDIFTLIPRHATRKLPPEVVLFDDIYTTGATMYACSQVLKTAGIDKVYSLTVAVDL